MNTTMLRQFFDRIPQRTRVVLIAALAFCIGTLFGGAGGGTGRYVPAGTPDGNILVLDTKTGTLWTVAPGGAYKRLASFSYF